MAANKTSNTGLLDGLFENMNKPQNTEASSNVNIATPVMTERQSPVPVKEAPSQAPVQQPYMDIEPRKGVGRPKDPGEYQKVCIRLTKENYTKARIESGKYGGVTAYLNYLIEHA